jgi:hypothetical protein
VNDRVVMGVHSRRCARCLVPSPVLGEGRGECMISVTNSGCGARWTSPPARPGRGRTLLSSTGVVQEVSRKRRTPILKHADQRAACDMRRQVLLKCERQSHTINRRLNQKIDIVRDERTAHSDGQRLPPLLELPVIHTRGPVSKVEASMIGQISRCLRAGL